MKNKNKAKTKAPARFYFLLSLFFPFFLPSVSSSILCSSLRGSGQPSSSAASSNFSRLRPVFFFSFFYFPFCCSSISSNRKTLNPKPPPLENPNTFFNLQNWDPVICSKFFHWAGKQKGYYHNFASYNAFAYCLNRSNQFRAADQVPDQRKYFWAIFFSFFWLFFFLGCQMNF